MTEGHGRPRLYDEPTTQRMVSLPQSQVEYLLALGGGNFSRGVRVAAERCARQDGWTLPGERPGKETEAVREEGETPQAVASGT